MALSSLDALATGDDHAHTAIVDFLADDALHLLIVFRQRNNHAHVLRLHTEASADALETTCASRVLSTRHASGQVVADADGDVCLRIHSIEQTGHAAVGEC